MMETRAHRMVAAMIVAAIWRAGRDDSSSARAFFTPATRSPCSTDNWNLTVRAPDDFKLVVPSGKAYPQIVNEADPPWPTAVSVASTMDERAPESETSCQGLELARWAD
jgi:hypothetical protein